MDYGVSIQSGMVVMEMRQIVTHTCIGLLNLVYEVNVEGFA